MSPWGMILAGWISHAHCLEFTGMNVGRATMSDIPAWKSAIEYISLPSNIRLLGFYFWTSPRNACMPVLQGYQRVKKNTSVRELGYLFHKYPTMPLQMPKSVCLPEVTRRKRTKTWSFTLSTADRQLRLGMTDGVVNLLCHSIGNWMIPHFCTSVF